VYASTNLIPVARQGSIYNGLVHISDWFPTFLHLASGGSWTTPTNGQEIDGMNIFNELATGTSWEVLRSVRCLYLLISCEPPFQVPKALEMRSFTITTHLEKRARSKSATLSLLLEVCREPLRLWLAFISRVHTQKHASWQQIQLELQP